MSCTVIALPYAIAWVVGSIIISTATAGHEINKKLNNEALTIDNNSYNNNDIQVPCEEVNIISEQQFLEKSFETPFMDKNILLKTIKEHGVINIKENEYGKITGVCGNYELSFEKLEESKPYFVLMKHLSTENADEKMQDLTNEYSINVQEESYNNIIEKLKENNMEIEDEEVYEDNTIVLTINLD